MSRPILKICGLSETASIDAAIDAGASLAGFIFFKKSPRYISLAQAEQLSAHIGARIGKVAVTVDEDDDGLEAIINALEPDWLQLHGAESSKRVEAIKTRFSLPIIKALAIEDASDLDKVKAYEGLVDNFLFDAKPPKGSELPGGNAVSFDWQLLENFSSSTPWFLAGGLNANNICQALAKSGARAIDISSGVETAPGQKSIEKIIAFARAIRV